MMTFTDELRAANRPAWDYAAGHRFTAELMAGTLPDPVMARYLIQDHRFLDNFLALTGAALATADSLEARLRLGRFAGATAGEENTYFERAFAALGVTAEHRRNEPDTPPTAGFQALMAEAAETRSYAVALTVLTAAEWLYLDWARRAAATPPHFVHAEWITLHDNPDFREIVTFLRRELDHTGPADPDRCRDFFRRTVTLEGAFFDAAYGASKRPGTPVRGRAAG